MDKLGIKGTLYDLLGYIVPGSVFIVGIYILYLIKNFGKLSCILNQIMDMKIGLFQGSMLIIIAYILGHVFASIGSFIFENRKMSSLYEKDWFYNKLYKISEKKVGITYKEQFEKIIGTHVEFDFRNVISFSEENAKSVYNTAFVFLSIYGFSRSTFIAMLFVYVSHWFVFEDSWSISLHVFFIVCMIALLHNYLRFRAYYIKHIYASLSSKIG